MFGQAATIYEFIWVNLVGKDSFAVGYGDSRHILETVLCKITKLIAQNNSNLFLEFPINTKLIHFTLRTNIEMSLQALSKVEESKINVQ